MSGEYRRSTAPQDPPWSLELLADLHAGVLDTETAAWARERAARDPWARGVLAALDDTLDELRDPDTNPTSEPIPDDVASRIDLALAEESRSRSAVPETRQLNPPGPAARPVTATRPPTPMPTAGHPPVPAAAQPPGTAGERPPGAVDSSAVRHNVVELGARRRRRARFAWSASLVAAAASIAAIVLFAFDPVGSQHDEQAQQPNIGQPPAVEAPTNGQSSGESAPLALQGEQVNLTGEQFSQVVGTQQYAALDGPEQPLDCLRANGVTSGKPLGAREITLNGQPAQLFILPTGEIGQFRLLAVAPDCAAGNPATISDSTFGG